YTGKLPPHILDRTRRAYYAQLAHLDFQIGRVIWFIQRHMRELHNTLVIFSSDHGELLGDHHLWRKFIAFEGSIKVPMIIRPPHSGGDVPRGSCDDRNVCLEDIMPTLLEEAGI